MLSSATYLWNCTYTVKKLWITTLYIGYAVWVRTFIDNCKPPAKSQHNGPLRPSRIVFVLIVIFRHYLPTDFLTEHWGIILVCYKPTRTPHLGQLVVLRNRLSIWLNNKKWYLWQYHHQSRLKDGSHCHLCNNLIFKTNMLSAKMSREFMNSGVSCLSIVTA